MVMVMASELLAVDEEECGHLDGVEEVRKYWPLPCEEKELNLGRAEFDRPTS